VTRPLGRQVAQGQHQPIGGSVISVQTWSASILVQEVRSEAGCSFVALIKFSACLHAINLVVERLGQSRQIGEDEAAIGAVRPGPDAGDDGARALPAFRELADFLGLVLGQGGVLGGRAEMAPLQHRIARKAEDVAIALSVTPCHRLGPAVMAVVARHDLDHRPAGPDAADD